MNLVHSLSEDDENNSLHAHNHSNRDLPQSKLILVFIITLIFMVVEVIVGYLANSLALIADAGHMLNDVISLLFAIVAIMLSSKKSNSKFTFGYKRVEVLSGLANGISLLAISGYIILEALERSMADNEIIVEGGLVLGVGFLGLIINIFGVYLLESEKDGSINIEGAYQHLIADLLGSVAAMIAGISIILYSAYWMDTVASITVSLLILKTGFSISLRSIKILIEATPEGVDLDKIKSELQDIHGVVDIHDFHAWRVTDGFDLLTAHVIVKSYEMSELIKNTAATVSRNHGFNHTTFQIELDPCLDIDENC
jgi:cobalt-zinc-cadmium efflux system protein